MLRACITGGGLNCAKVMLCESSLKAVGPEWAVGWVAPLTVHRGASTGWWPGTIDRAVFTATVDVSISDLSTSTCSLRRHHDFAHPRTNTPQDRGESRLRRLAGLPSPTNDVRSCRPQYQHPRGPNMAKADPFEPRLADRAGRIAGGVASP
jgi:hypothetical protein